MTYELINTLTANTLASFDTEDEARAALEEFTEADEPFASTLQIVAFDDDGLAVEVGLGEVRQATPEEADEITRRVVRPYGHANGRASQRARS
jgi:hypothetical protein